MSEKLKPCPFCGESELEELVDEDGDFVWCMNCGARGPWADMLKKRGSSSIARQVWNKRVGHEVEEKEGGGE